ncbi:hypothetical protein L249_1368 [Ophiocordyceps polyrhachis-furcata BCC 54312]|uniref:Myb-like domain-containing protein n=1 Tax=Ophiocordyceps polyrhachis-furcata BCC 54312 TaxID=1330021 RepID=A0A367KYZ6_9HYPO|nr:hypothetical protein L249_1368 [Ophiocordyceps polyrhachis-furcata BCC 54312]
MATIEPRLIHLLNESKTPQHGHAELPPLNSLPLQTWSDERPLMPPLGPTTRPRLSDPVVFEEAGNSRKEDSRSAFVNIYLLTPPHPVVDAVTSEWPSQRGPPRPPTDDVYPMMRFDDFHLRQPMKKQKTTQGEARPMPPMINGLLEPPPDAAIFPPIAASSARPLLGHYEFGQSKAPTDLPFLPESDVLPANTTSRARKRAVRPRRKWSEQETEHLLLGVSRHGVGKWTTILEDGEFVFNDRTAGDLKDRFRTCCPEELRNSRHGSPSKANIADSNDIGQHEEENGLQGLEDTSEALEKKQSRAHRINMEHLHKMGIHEFKGSDRRVRCPFTALDDRDILRGLCVYGPAWTKIQRDSRLNLCKRQPTDLRDRIRNKYMDVYHCIEKGALRLKGGDRGGSNIPVPPDDMSIDSLVDLLKRSKTKTPTPTPTTAGTRQKGSNKGSHKGSNTEVLYPTSAHAQPPPQAVDSGDLSWPQPMSSENEISRLLHDNKMLHRVLQEDGTSALLIKRPKKHQKRLSAPSHWLLDKLGGTYAPKPSAGPHKQRDCMPLIVFIRNRLKYALNFRETRAILMQRLVKVDGKVRTDMTYPAGFMDVITIEKTGENFRLVYDTKGRFTVHRIQAEEAEYKLGKVKRVQLGRGGIPFLVTHDARTIRYPDPLIKVNDTVKIDLNTGKITEFIKFDTGAIAMVTGGRNMGRVGVITHRERHDGGFNIVHIKDAIDNSFATRESNVFVIGQEKPWISLPKGKGVKLTIAEERDRRRALAQAH